MGDILAAFLLVVAIGLVVGILASLIGNGGALRRAGDIVAGVVGAICAGFVFPMLGYNFSGSLLSGIVATAAGSVVVLLIARFIRGAVRRSD